MGTPKISIIIPSFNKIQFISKTLDSIIDQKYPDLEVIVQDGGSTDGTFEVVKNYAKRYPDVFRIESKKDGGQTSAINIGFLKARGEIVTFINADDVYTPKAFDIMAEVYMKYPEAIWFAGRGKVIDKKGLEIARLSTLYKNLLLSLNSRFHLLSTNYLTQSSVFLTKKTYVKYGPFHGMTNGIVMEYEFWLRLSEDSMPIVVPGTLSSFRITEENISSTSYKDTLKEDEMIAKRFTRNKFIILLHKFNNLLRVITIKLISKSWL